jgi:hypothetical protein
MHVSRPCVIRRYEQLVVRHQTRGAEDVVPVFQEQAGSGEASAELRADELLEARTWDGHSEQEEP